MSIYCYVGIEERRSSAGFVFVFSGFVLGYISRVRIFVGVTFPVFVHSLFVLCVKPSIRGGIVDEDGVGKVQLQSRKSCFIYSFFV